MKSIAIIGGGVAGCATAISLQKQMKGAVDIALYDAGEFDSLAPQAVGETLAPPAQGLLAEMGLNHLIKHDLPAAGSISLWGSDVPGFMDSWTEITGSAIFLDRARFNQSLQRETSHYEIKRISGARLISVEHHSWQKILSLTIKKSGRLVTLTPDFIVDATGSAAVIARRLGIYRNRIDQLLATSIFLEGRHGLTDRFLIEAVYNGWWYAAPLPNEKAIVSFYRDRKAEVKEKSNTQTKIESSQDLIDALMQTLWLKKNIALKSCDLAGFTHTNAESAVLSTVIGENWLAVGDAACSFDPLSSAGITKALLNGKLAADAISDLWGADGQSLTHYQNQIFTDFNNYITARCNDYNKEKRFSSCDFWLRRQKDPRSLSK